jgi:Zn-dependent protease
LFIFNILPIPPLDGFHILENLLPGKYYKQLDFINRYGFIILIIVVITPQLSYILLDMPISFILSLIYSALGIY